METLFLEVVTPEGVLVSQEVDMVIVPGSEGEFGVLPGHMNFLSGIVPGELRFYHGGASECMAVSSGFAEVSNNSVSIIVDTAERAGDIDLERARSAKDKARERMEKEKDPADFLRAEVALKRAISRIKVVEKAL
ncbi:MAG TPA: F0F1 ATP synthase subunit epsilon [Desulfatiglandales bacterium]|nr:F0F1 ATP synthase subunit epsilon [Desulfatiglandales bacterium]